MYEVVFSKQAVKDSKHVKKSYLRSKAKGILSLLAENPFASPPSYEKLTGNLAGYYSRRLNRQHRIVYEVYEKEKIVRVIRLWTHYE